MTKIYPIPKVVILKYSIVTLILIISCIQRLEAQLTLQNYQLSITPDLYEESIRAVATLDIKAPISRTSLGLFLSPEFSVSKLIIDGRTTTFERHDHNLSFTIPNKVEKPIRIVMYYSGSPTTSTNPPWIGGFYQCLDYKDRSWLNTAPIKDPTQSWIPVMPGVAADSSTVSITVRDRLTAISNGKIIDQDHDKDKRRITYTYRYAAPIQPIDLQLHVGYYATYDTTFTSIDGQIIELSHYVQDYNLDRATKHLNQLGRMLTAWEHYLGPLPDTLHHLQTVEVPFAGSSVTGLIQYGNRFMRGSYGGFIPRDMNWDHELVRSTAGLYLDHRFPALKQDDRWLKPALTTYLESLFVEFHYGKEKATQYLELYKPYVRERQPLIDSLSSDHDLHGSEFQAKGALLFHTIRNSFKYDGDFLFLLRDYLLASPNKDETAALIERLSRQTQHDWTSFFKQYLHHYALPDLIISSVINQNGTYTLKYRLQANVADFVFPIYNQTSGSTIWLPTTNEEFVSFPGSPGNERIRLRQSKNELRLVNYTIISSGKF